MPLLLEPKQLYPVVLECDQDKPAETQPQFLCRALSARESIANSDSLSELLAKGDVGIFDYLEKIVEGWKNMNDPSGKPLVFADVDLKDVLTTKEAWELFNKANRNDHLSESDKKKSE